MHAQSLVIFIVVGVIAGGLAGQVVRGGGFGLIGDLIVGIIGAVIAGWLFPRLTSADMDPHARRGDF